MTIWGRLACMLGFHDRVAMRVRAGRLPMCRRCHSPLLVIV